MTNYNIDRFEGEAKHVDEDEDEVENDDGDGGNGEDDALIILMRKYQMLTANGAWGGNNQI